MKSRGKLDAKPPQPNRRNSFLGNCTNRARDQLADREEDGCRLRNVRKHCKPMLPGTSVGVNVHDVLWPSRLGQNANGIEFQAALARFEIEAPVARNDKLLSQLAPQEPASLTAVENVRRFLRVILVQKVAPQLQLGRRTMIVGFDLTHRSASFQ